MKNAQSTVDTASNSIEHQSGYILRLIDRVGHAFMKRPAWLAAVVIMALVFLPMAVWLDLKHLSNDALTRQAVDLNKMISEIRGYYARNVVGRILKNNGKSTPTHNYKDVDGGIPIPATLSIELGNLLGGKKSNIGYSFLSDYVFSNRESRELTSFETTAIKQFRKSKNSDDRLIKISGTLLRRQINMAVPVIMGKSCVACHNSHPLSPKKDWKVGDVRGIQSIRVEQPIAANIFSFKYLLVYLLLASTIGFSFVVLQWRQAVQYARLNTDLEEANSFLASVSMKISKYLSPQVYKSIFRGERDVVISTERKKLTIFFSDIKDFTATSERLQPEELTALLNEYFTEMEKIAHEHGATVDKFIGDAILAFFGDPETKGAHLDAQQCVKMAIAMQQRMVSLNQEWHQRGIEKPFRVRMGINTGYCNVGNFGSEDRMDYTIIGAEANLAARLESIASPGGIVISFETYSLVQNIIHAKPMNEISLKGISRKIIPYEIANIYGTISNPGTDILNKNTDRLSLKIDLTDISGSERYEIENALKLALATVNNPPQTD